MAATVTARELAQFSPLDALSPENLKEIARKARCVNVAAGRYLFRDGERSSAQLFLLEGRIELYGAAGVEQTVEGGTPSARSAVESIAPRARAARARSDAVAVAVDRDLLDLMLTWDQTGSYRVEELSDGGGDPGEADWMTRLLQTECFRRIPPANIQAIFMRMEPVGFRAGDVVIRQGDGGDYFYIIRDGRCLVTRRTRSRPDGIRLAELGPGESFGEEALISDKARNASVTMLSRGTLMRMSKSDFNALLNDPLLEWVDLEAADTLDADWIDVRLPAEFESGHIDGATNTPLFVLRMKAQKMDPRRTYLIYCDTGRRSAAASFILSERGFDVRVLRGGLEHVPGERIVRDASA